MRIKSTTRTALVIVAEACVAGQLTLNSLIFLPRFFFHLLLYLKSFYDDCDLIENLLATKNPNPKSINPI